MVQLASRMRQTVGQYTARMLTVTVMVLAESISAIAMTPGPLVSSFSYIYRETLPCPGLNIHYGLAPVIESGLQLIQLRKNIGKVISMSSAVLVLGGAFWAWVRDIASLSFREGLGKLYPPGDNASSLPGLMFLVIAQLVYNLKL